MRKQPENPLREARQGDEAAFLWLFDEHHPPLFRFAWRLTGSMSDAEDIVQECFLALLKPACSFDPARSSMRTYLFGAVRNQALKRLQRQEQSLAAEPILSRTPEAELLREFAEIAPGQGYSCEWQEPGEILRRSAAIQPAGLRGGLWSPTEITVDPRRIVAGLPDYLRSLGVEFRFGEPVRRIDLPTVETATEQWQVDAAIVCSGEDFETLFPEVFADSGLTRCKLQMMRTAPQPAGWQLGPALAAGLTLRFYKAFHICSALAPLKERVAREMPEYDRWAIHVLASQTEDGAITLGDSHEYGACPDIFDKPEIDDLILKEAATFLRLPDPRIAQRWNGTYAIHPNKPFLEAEPAPGVRVVTAPGGSGMTLSFGLAESVISRGGF